MDTEDAKDVLVTIKKIFLTVMYTNVHAIFWIESILLYKQHSFAYGKAKFIFFSV